jgi:hypothetical protein
MQVVRFLVICGIFEFILVVEGLMNPHVQGAIATLLSIHTSSFEGTLRPRSSNRPLKRISMPPSNH